MGAGGGGIGNKSGKVNKWCKGSKLDEGLGRLSEGTSIGLRSEAHADLRKEHFSLRSQQA